VTAGSLTIKDYMPPMAVDRGLLAAVAALVSIGLIMVTSSSLDFADAVYGDAWYFAKKQFIYLSLGVVGGLVVASVPTPIWERYSGLLLLLAIVFWWPF
jgi:cell division-specific peptidoglycan biosynthesis regulator FtsW